MKERNYPVTIQIYLGSGKKGEKLRANLMGLTESHRSLSQTILDLLREAKPALFKGVDNDRKI